MTITIHLPQIILTTLLILGVLKVLMYYGEEKKPDTYDRGDLIAAAIIFALLYSGGFYG